MKKLSDILYKVNIIAVNGITDIEVTNVVSDSREVNQGACFVAVRGIGIDGHKYIGSAIQKGAVAVICEEMPVEFHPGVTFVKVYNSSIAAGMMAHQFQGDPSAEIKVVGVTGTNGKTTVATLLYQLYTELGYTCGLISTVKYVIGETEIPSTHTTPDAIRISQMMRKMYDAGCTHVFMECSSHAIHQHRISGIHFSGAIFTNISHDHLDYHQTFDEYIKVKKSFFDTLGSDAFAISNIDDKRGTVMLQNTVSSKFYYSLKTIADFKGKLLDNSLSGLHMLINDQEVNFRMIGSFNAYNILAVYGASVCMGEDKGKVLTILSNLTGAEGRFEHIQSDVDKIIGIVDYAHTPDALQNVLETIRNLRKDKEKIITVVGCGGDRDKTKRPIMAEIACEYSDKAIFTSDNPRSEDPATIILDMTNGLSAEMSRKYVAITDRREAIKAAVNMAGKEDIILVAGKGHEKYQEVQGVKHAFDDKEILKNLFQNR
ncbi:MAG: UDP-N-acetylmuramoyl-L-alanyl-D-glutamate--2,6-diaminopimelate ligase [Chitinophagaceae bacterium]